MNVVIHKTGIERLVPVKLPDPKEGQLKTYMIDELNFTVNEVTRYHDNFRSWFADDMLSKQGSIYMVTPVDSLFIMLPFVMKYRSTFRTLQDILTSTEHYQSLMSALSPNTSWTDICDTQHVDDELYIRYSEEKTLLWLATKFDKSCVALREDIGPTAPQTTIRSYAFDWICQYLPEDLGKRFRQTYDLTGGVREEPEVRENADSTPSLNQRMHKRSASSSEGPNAKHQKVTNSSPATSTTSDTKPTPKEDKTNQKLTKWFSAVAPKGPPSKRLKES